MNASGDFLTTYRVMPNMAKNTITRNAVSPMACTVTSEPAK